MAASPEKKRVLFISPLLAMPSQHGGCVYPHAILTELHRQGFAIDYAWLGAPLQGGRRWMRDPLNNSYVSSGWVRGTRKVGNFRLPDNVPGWVGRSERLPYDRASFGGEHRATEAERHFARRVLTRTRADLVIIDSTPMLTLLDDLAPSERARLKVAVLTHNLTFRRAELYRSHGQPLDFLPLTQREETELLSRADVIVAIQEREAAAFRSMLPERSVITVPMPILAQPQPRAAEILGRCLFVGGYSGHNIEAVNWLLREIWPEVLKEVPHAQLTIAGTVGKAVKTDQPSVKVTGPVADLKDVYATTSVCVVPLPLGTGLKIKLVEAMSFGRAVVTTSAGAEGYEDIERGETVAVADQAETFAHKTAELLLSDELRRQRINAQLSALQQFMAPPVALRALVGAINRP
jgi:glycosyltransferase involved in cell wall biosynthesis